jgi:hypothetical protein
MEAIDALHAATAIYTAEPVVDILLDHIDWPRADRRLVDPSCGDGVFLGRALLRLLTHESGITPERLGSILEGWEVHPQAAGEARERLGALLVQHGWGLALASNTARAVVRNADFLTEGPTAGQCFHAIAGNPPYLRYANVPALLRDEYKAVVPGHAQADLLHSFLDRCADVLAPDGEIALVTADRWLFNMGASALRTALGRRLGISHLARLDTNSAFYRPKNRRAGSAPRVHPVAVVLRAATDGAIRLDGEAIYPESNNLPTADRSLGDVAHVRLSPWLGSPGIFMVDAQTAKRFPPECLVPAVDTDDIVDGVLQMPKRYALRTSPETEPPAEVMAHLDAQLRRMAARGRRNPRWLPPETWQKLDLTQPSLLIPRIAKSLRPVLLPPGVLPVNHNLSVVTAGEMSLEEIAVAMASDRAQEWMNVYAPRLEGGYRSLTTTLLRKMPIY